MLSMEGRTGRKRMSLYDFSFDQIVQTSRAEEEDLVGLAWPVIDKHRKRLGTLAAKQRAV